MDDEKKKEALGAKWQGLIERAGKGRQEGWEKAVNKIVARYRDERDDSGLDTSKKLNILWSNVETLKPALFSKTPKPTVSRRFSDSDPIAKKACEALERTMHYAIDVDDLDGTLAALVEDYLLGGRAIARPVYKPVFGEPQVVYDEQGLAVLDDDGEIKTFTPVESEDSCIEYHHWADVRLGPSRSWHQMPWIAWRHYMDRSALEERFGESINITKINFGHVAEGEEPCENGDAEIWEIWDKSKEQVLWLTGNYILEVSEPPLTFKNFFNTPKPLLATTTNGSLIPVPDFTLYQDQADEIDAMTARIEALVDALKVIGFYPGDEHAVLSQAFTSGEENRLVPVQDWAMFADRGGVAGAISWYPIENTVAVLQQLYSTREIAKQDLYEITGISDLLRGAGEAAATATSERIKGKFATLRLSARQERIHRYVRDLLEMQAEVICEQYSIETIAAVSGLDYSPEEWEQIDVLFKDESVRGFRIDVETDAMIAVDQETEQNNKTAFITAATTMLKEFAEIGAGNPAAVPLLGKMMLFGLRGFKVGRELEEAIEQTIEAMAQPQDTGPSEEEIQAQRDQLELIKQEIMASIEKDRTQAEKNTADVELKQAEALRKLADTEKLKVEAASIAEQVASDTMEDIQGMFDNANLPKYM